ncbi:hypothetical protein [Pontibacter litorisediminis]|uniref:hypothetical protein n=1 Tax=Pontibacter litorisediminis TaxID=1846260 RepID=UPI0023EC2981|nr:hypothetical protein [Pontibacter litorisediminis]
MEPVKVLLPALFLLAGKLWDDRASFSQITLIVSLSLIPEVMYLTNILLVSALSGEVSQGSYLLMLVGWVLSIRILVIGLSKVQGFDNGLSLLSVLYIVYGSIVLYITFPERVDYFYLVRVAVLCSIVIPFMLRSERIKEVFVN